MQNRRDIAGWNERARAQREDETDYRAGLYLSSWPPFAEAMERYRGGFKSIRRDAEYQWHYRRPQL